MWNPCISIWTSGIFALLTARHRTLSASLGLRAESIEILSSRIQDSEGRYLFCSERNPLKKLSLSTVEKWHVKVRRNLGLPCVLYNWRHTFATRAAEAGISLAALARILGHSDDLRSVMKYVHPSQREQDRAMEGLSHPKPECSRT
jgi:integrase